MSSCFFIGHRDCPFSVQKKLENTITELITNHSVNTFYVGNHGNFDAMATGIITRLKENFNIDFYVVLAYMPSSQQTTEKTILPDGIENIPKKFAISYRNKWMISHSDFLICYVDNDIGNASKYLSIAKKAGIRCFNIAEGQK